MTIECRVVGVRLYPQSKASTRRITLEWSDPERKPSDEEPFPVIYTHVLELNDDIKEFDLGDVVNITLSLSIKTLSSLTM
jgi:hypothetical protein